MFRLNLQKIFLVIGKNSFRTTGVLVRAEPILTAAAKPCGDTIKFYGVVSSLMVSIWNFLPDKSPIICAGMIFGSEVIP